MNARRCWAGHFAAVDAGRRAARRAGLIVAGLVLAVGLGLFPGLVRADGLPWFRLQVVQSTPAELGRVCPAITGKPADHCAMWFAKTRTCVVFVPAEDRHYSATYRYWGHEVAHCDRWAVRK